MVVFAGAQGMSSYGSGGLQAPKLRGRDQPLTEKSWMRKTSLRSTLSKLKLHRK